ncbi:MAG TPA: hypothetical protein VFV96_00570 [Verrucomicrobiae bacterium]|nr:hypothetical protein [Verrucomicrobiae bacterium]
MKGSQAVRWAACVLVAAFSFNHSEAQSARYVIGERGLNHRVWQKVVAQTNANGQVMLVTNRAYVELCSGLYFTNAQGQLQESKEGITILPAGGAAAVQGQHKVYFPSDIHEGVIELVTPDGRHLKSRPWASVIMTARTTC